MAEIYHMVPAAEWTLLAPGSDYAPGTVPAEGFIHCTTGEANLIDVAGRYYPGSSAAWLVLVIDPARVRAEIRWEVQPEGIAYPHIHGPLNTDAVTAVLPFPRDASGAFLPFRFPPGTQPARG